MRFYHAREKQATSWGLPLGVACNPRYCHLKAARYGHKSILGNLYTIPVDPGRGASVQKKRTIKDLSAFVIIQGKAVP